MNLLDGFADPDVSATAAKIPAHAFAQFLFCKVGATVVRYRTGHSVFEFGKHADCGADLTGRAVTALEAIVLNKGLLQRVQLTIPREAFDGDDLTALVLHGERQAGVDALPVDQNCACAASSLIAAFLRALQAEVIAKSVEQRYAWLNREFSLDAINLLNRRLGGNWRLSCSSDDSLR